MVRQSLKLTSVHVAAAMLYKHHYIYVGRLIDLHARFSSGNSNSCGVTHNYQALSGISKVCM